ncbi:MAG: hypothetical protein PHY05_07270 [Methanothrix sp.]|nr:hypothetical protein [Methanothrix sp.]
METLVGMAYKLGDLADHTFVYCRDNGQYFDCFGGHESLDDRRDICSGVGLYKVANCYRLPMFGLPDTAGVGPYAVDGVCHQAANRFLFSALTTLNYYVRGYWFSNIVYGTWGKSYPLWLATIYLPCSISQAVSAAPVAPAAMPVAVGANASDLFKKIQGVYSSVPRLMRGTESRDPEEIAREISVKDMVAHASFIVPELDPIKITEIHREFLKERDAVFGEGLKGTALSDKVNSMMKDVQKALADSLDSDTYRKLSGGIEPGETINVVDREIAAKAGTLR